MKLRIGRFFKHLAGFFLRPYKSNSFLPPSIESCGTLLLAANRHEVFIWLRSRKSFIKISNQVEDSQKFVWKPRCGSLALMPCLKFSDSRITSQSLWTNQSNWLKLDILLNFGICWCLADFGNWICWEGSRQSRAPRQDHANICVFKVSPSALDRYFLTFLKFKVSMR